MGSEAIANISGSGSPDHDKTYFQYLLTITKGGGITFAGMMVGKVLLLLYAFFLAKVLPPPDLGLYFLGVTIITMLTAFTSLGLNTGVVRFVSIYHARRDVERSKGTTLISAFISVLSSLLIVLLILLFADFIARTVFDKPELAYVLKLFSLSIPFEVLMRIFLSCTQALKLIHYNAITENLAWVGLRFLFSLVFVFLFGLELKGVIIAYILSSVISSGLAFHFANRNISLLGRSVDSQYEISRLLRFSIPMVLSVVILNVSNQLDVLMLGLFLPAASIGIYSIAVRLIVLAEFVYQVFNPIFNPFVSELHDKKEFGKLSWFLKVITRWNVTISFPIFLALLCFPDFFLGIFGAGFRQASSCLSILVIGRIFRSLSSLPNTMIFMSGRSDITLKNNIVILLINLLLNYLLIPKFGIVGAALAAATSFMLIGAIRIVEVYRLMGIHPLDSQLWKPIVSGMTSLAVVLMLRLLLPTDTSGLALILVGVFFAAYFFLIHLFRLNEEEVLIKSLIKGKLASLTKGYI